MRGFLKFVLWTTVICGVIGSALYFLVFDPWIVPGDDPMFTASIAPLLLPGDHLLLSKSAELKHGHLVRCMDPDAPGRFVVGRIVATAGETIEIGELVTVQSKRNPSPRACNDSHVVIRHPATGEDVHLQCAVEDTYGVEHDALRDLEHPQGNVRSKVDANRVYLASDNRHIHQDSRDFGQVSPLSCQHIVYRLWGESYFESGRRFNFIW